MAENEIVITRLVNAPRARVWQMFTEAKHIKHWWGPNGFTNTIFEMDVRVGGIWRFVMHGPDGERFAAFEVIREFSAAHVAPARAAAVRVAQRQWLLEWARALALTPPLDAVRAEMLNIVAMLEGAVADGAACEAIELLAVLRRCFEDVELPAAGLHQLERAIDACADAVQASRGHTLVAALLFNAGEAASALRHAEAGLAAAAVLTKAQHARALHALASVRWRSTKQAHDVLPLIDQAEVLAESAVADDVLASLCALRAFIVGQHLRDAAQAEALHARATELWRRQGNQHAVNSGLYNLAVVASRSGQAERALALIAAVLDSAQRHGDSHRARQALNVKGNALVALRRWREAAEVLRECVQQSWAAMATHDLAYGLWNLPRVLAHQRQHEAAVRIAACATSYTAADGVQFPDMQLGHMYRHPKKPGDAWAPPAR